MATKVTANWNVLNTEGSAQTYPDTGRGRSLSTFVINALPSKVSRRGVLYPFPDYRKSH
jgi:hypothetical protein